MSAGRSARERARPALPRVPAVVVLAHHLVGYRRTWRAGIFSSFLLPVLTVLGFGVGVGSYIDQGIGGVSYLDWIVPGLIASTALQTAVSESTWPVFGNFQWVRTYFAQSAAPLRVGDILSGHLAFVVFRVLTTIAAFLLVTALFGALRAPWAVAVLPVVALLGLAVAAPTFAYAAVVSVDSWLAMLLRFAVIPMTLFAGVFFPVESLPLALRWLAYATPLWHGVELCRAATLGVAPQWSVAGHLLYLAAWAVAGWLLARRAFRRRLVV
ncbi:ABC transporter permease [Micromonospora peucetia]|uniref:Transport permease protein n=1 Tax=Micromonospora peucetia TaxID=47871 RepID=A0ABZ1E7S0_9ACTN|nr:ABC transporter permease [Micromonospora peucetia]MCX4388853.1 ABC transporter permease [Micromonospora peucetia]WSA30524.1 ABC transporter permease [Micromonospora peucetia]